MNVSTKDYVLVILSCKKYRKERREKQITQFLTNPQIMNGIPYFHVEGNPKLFTFKKHRKKQYIINEKERVIYTNTKDDYLSLAHKTIMAFKAIVENFDFKYILKTDDDQRLIVPKFFTQLHENLIKTTPDYVGRIFNMPEKIEKYQPVMHKEDGFPHGYVCGDNLPFTNGRFYALSKRNVTDLVENKFDSIKEELCEDWAIAKYQKLEFRKNILSFFTEKIFQDYLEYEKEEEKEVEKEIEKEV
jgi:hypothetical protein